jgi:cysteine desulfurase
LFIKTGTRLQPLIVGGGQEAGWRSGTENVPSVIGLAKALESAQTARTHEATRVRKLRDLFQELILNNIEEATVNSSAKLLAPHILHLSFPGFDGERLMMELDERGIQCAVGSACSAANVEPSHVLTAIGLSDKLARSSLRFSFGRQTTEADIHHAIKVFGQLTGRG